MNHILNPDMKSSKAVIRVVMNTIVAISSEIQSLNPQNKNSHLLLANTQTQTQTPTPPGN